MMNATPGDAGGPTLDAQVVLPPDAGAAADAALAGGTDAPVASPMPDGSVASPPPDGPVASPPPDGPVASSCSSTGSRFAEDFLPVTADADFLYGWGTSSIVRVGRAGGTPAIVVADVDVVRSRDLIVDETSVYWSFRADEGSGKIFRAPKSGGAPQVLTAPEDFINGLAANSRDLFYIAGGAVMAIPKAGGTPIQIAKPPVPPDEIGPADDIYVFWGAVTRNESLEINRAPAGGGDAVNLTTFENGPGRLGPSNFKMVEDSAFLYMFNAAHIYRIDRSDGSVLQIYDPPLDGPHGWNALFGLALDGEWVYWLSFPLDVEVIPDAASVLLAVHTDGSAVRTLVDAPWPSFRLNSMALWGDSIFYEEQALQSFAVYRLCKGD